MGNSDLFQIEFIFRWTKINFFSCCLLNERLELHSTKSDFEFSLLNCQLYYGRFLLRKYHLIKETLSNLDIVSSYLDAVLYFFILYYIFQSMFFSLAHNISVVFASFLLRLSLSICTLISSVRPDAKNGNGILRSFWRLPLP